MIHLIIYRIKMNTCNNLIENNIIKKCYEKDEEYLASF